MRDEDGAVAVEQDGGQEDEEGHTGGESFQVLVQSREGWWKACNKGNREGEGEVVVSVQGEDDGACGTAAHAYDPGTTRRLTRSSSVLV